MKIETCPECGSELKWIEDCDHGGYWFCYRDNLVVFTPEIKEHSAEASNEEIEE
jgi:hypothetical protein